MKRATSDFEKDPPSIQSYYEGTTLSNRKRGSYGFRFQDRSYKYLVNLWNIGWELQSSTDYCWDGNERDEIGKLIFQYTLSGTGKLEIEDQSYTLQKGQAFIVSIPSNHRYYFSGGSEPWEYIFLTLYGLEAEKAWSYITKRTGPILDIPPDSPLINSIFNIYKETRKENVKDAYYASALSYRFLMELIRFTKNNTNQDVIPTNIKKAITFMEDYLDRDLTLEDISEESNLSRYYFSKIFKEQVKVTPMQYLTQLRIKKSTYLLLQTNKTINEIAIEVGFKNGNYFNKVFKKSLGVSAGEFRKDNGHNFMDYIVTE
ncbi:MULTISPECIES: AraC family transcriptional regulator [Metabacillus]|uniref:HTH araC/xylS-type domain-containing protein n=2 Tax=Metabacillus TaxID=2675233 RepID=A0A179T5R7_9BACI|nr:MULTISPECIES: AraC family transcriptional regulator [Metabacillus]OAS89101.1 hypothetical protein A6K24_00615 [Metabacillus litoralis]QNF28614.1 AraC family transcriptional regulator [Metabacillus sp. KUDC1714]